MLKIYENDRETFQEKSKSNNRGSVLLADPANFISNFFLTSMSKFSIIPIPQEVRSLEYDKNIHIFKAETKLKPALLNVITRPRYNNLDKIFEKAEKALEEGNEVYATAEGGILFIEWLHQQNKQIENIECNIPLDDMGIIYNRIVNKPFYPISLDRLLKLFMLFYSKKLSKEDINLISAFQIELINMDNETDTSKIETMLNNVSTDNIQKIKTIIQNMKESEESTNNIPSINIFNKVLEEIISLENKLNSDTIKIFNDSFAKITSNEDKQDYFIDVYLEILY